MTAGGLRRGNWSVQELGRLRVLLPHRGVEQTARLLRRSPGSVRRKAFELLRVPARHGPWTGSDDDQLRRSWGAVEVGLLAAMLGRGAADVRQRAAQLRRARGSEPLDRREQQLMKRLYGSRSDADLEVCMMRDRSAIVAAAAELCLRKDKQFLAAVASGRRRGETGESLDRSMPRWTSDEVAKLRRLYPEHDNLAVARALGRSVTAVANKAHQLKIHKSARLLAELGRANIARRYQAEQGLDERVVDAAGESGDERRVGDAAQG